MGFKNVILLILPTLLLWAVSIVVSYVKASYGTEVYYMHFVFAALGVLAFFVNILIRRK